MRQSWTPCASASSSSNTARWCATSCAGSTARPTDLTGEDYRGISRMRAQFVFHEVWIGLRRNLTMTIALVVVVAISLSLLGTGLLFVKQVDNTRTYWQGKVQLSIYLCSGGTPSAPQCAENGGATSPEIAAGRFELAQTPR